MSSGAIRREPGQEISSYAERRPGGSWRAKRPPTTAISRVQTGQVRRGDDDMAPVSPLPLTRGLRKPASLRDKNATDDP